MCVSLSAWSWCGWNQSLRRPSIFIQPHTGHMQLLEASDETVWGWGCTFHLVAAWRGRGCTGRAELDRHLISCYLLVRPGYRVACLTHVKSGGLIKPTARQARAHERDDESWEWSGLWWILVLSRTDRGGGWRPACWEKLAVCGWKRQCTRRYYNAAFQ